MAKSSVAATSIATATVALTTTIATAAAATAAEATASAASATATAAHAASLSGLGRAKVEADSSAFNFLSYKSLDSLGCVSRVGKLDVSEATRTFGLSIFSDTDSLDFTALLEEVPDGLFSGAETKVAAEDSVRLTRGTGGNSGLLFSELNLKGASVKSGSVASSEGLDCFLVGSILDEGALLGVEVP